MLELKAEPRKILGRKTNRLRRAGFIPAVLYGHGKKNQNLSVEEISFLKILKEAGETTLIFLKIGEKKHNVLIHDFSRDILTDKIIHIDFYEVKMDEKIRAKVSLVFIGEAPVIKNEGGVLVRQIQEIEVSALPKDLPREITVDVSGLNTFEDRILVDDLKSGAGVEILAKPEEIIALVVPPRSERELEELKTKPEEKVEEVAVGEEGKGKGTEEETPAVKKEEKQG